jgi:hypothetical protein
MLSLIDTIIGFAVIMLLLSFLVKSLTSVIKNHFDYYSNNLKNEVMRLIDGTFKGGIRSITDPEKKKYLEDIIKDIQWKRLGEEYLTKNNMKWLLKKLGAPRGSLNNLRARVEVHRANISYAFEKRSKNITLALGLGLCLFLNINAVSIWKTLYSDQQLRSKFSSEAYVTNALEKAKDKIDEIEEQEKELKKNARAVEEPASKQSPGEESSRAETTENQGTTDNDVNRQLDDLKKQREELLEKIYHFRGEVSFGIGRIYTEAVGWPSLFYEFLGSLLTGILVSIGAPYWHDFLRAISSLRWPKAKAARK